MWDPFLDHYSYAAHAAIPEIWSATGRRTWNNVALGSKLFSV